MKSITITMRGAYSFRMVVGLQAVVVGAPTYVYGQVYRNGAVWGHAHASELDQVAPQTFEESLGGWEVGDAAQCVTWLSGGNGGITLPYVILYQFSIWGEQAIRPPDIKAGVVLYNGVL